MKRFIAVIFLIVIFHVCYSKSDTSSAKPRHLISVAYFGDQLSHPGAVVGYGYRIVTSKRLKHSFIIGVQVGGYHFPKNSNGVFLLPYLGYQHIHKSGFKYDLQFGAGYLHTIADGKVYEYKGGTFTHVKDAGQSRSMLPYVATGIGYHKYLAREGIGIAPFIRAGFYGYYPINQLWSLKVTWSLGIDFSF